MFACQLYYYIDYQNRQKVAILLRIWWILRYNAWSKPRWKQKKPCLPGYSPL